MYYNFPIPPYPPAAICRVTYLRITAIHPVAGIESKP